MTYLINGARKIFFNLSLKNQAFKEIGAILYINANQFLTRYYSLLKELSKIISRSGYNE